MGQAFLRVLRAGLSASTWHQPPPFADAPEGSAKKRRAAGLAVGLLGLGLMGLGGYMIATG